MQYTFPCSDPISVDACCGKDRGEARSTFTRDTRPPGAGADPQTTDTTSRPR